jgi:hypothetical protein
VSEHPRSFATRKPFAVSRDHDGLRARLPLRRLSGLRRIAGARTPQNLRNIEFSRPQPPFTSAIPTPTHHADCRRRCEDFRGVESSMSDTVPANGISSPPQPTIAHPPDDRESIIESIVERTDFLAALDPDFAGFDPDFAG